MEQFHRPLLLYLFLFASLSLGLAAVTATHNYSSQQQDGLSCAQGFVLHDNFCYRYFGAEVRRPFHQAQKLCSRFTSSLVSLHSQQEEQFVVRLVLNHAAFWIGLNDEDGPGQNHKEGYFKWSSGIDEKEFVVDGGCSYCHWKSGEPHNKHHLDCVKVDVDGSGWAMAPGGCAATTLPFVCKKRACPSDLWWDGQVCSVQQVPAVSLVQPTAVEGLVGGQQVIPPFVVFVLVLVLLLVLLATCFFLNKPQLNKDIFPT